MTGIQRQQTLARRLSAGALRRRASRLERRSARLARPATAGGAPTGRILFPKWDPPQHELRAIEAASKQTAAFEAQVLAEQPTAKGTPQFKALSARMRDFHLAVAKAARIQRCTFHVTREVLTPAGLTKQAMLACQGRIKRTSEITGTCQSCGREQMWSRA